MASSWPAVKVFLTSHAQDFMKEREVILKEVIPSVRLWCEEKKILLQFKEVRWGRETPEEKLVGVLKDIEESYYNNIMPIFINVSCENLGIIPLWGDAPDFAVNEYQEKLKMTEFEMDMLYCAHRPDNINSIFLVRDDSFMNELLPEEQTFFTAIDLISSKSKEYGETLLLRYSTDRVLRYSYTTAGWDWDADRIKVKISENFIPQLKEMIERCIKRDFSVIDAPVLDTFDQVKESHSAFMVSRSSKVRGRSNVIQQIEDYIVSGDHDVPLLLLGGAGSGKTSIMANAAHHIEKKVQSGDIGSVEGQPWHIFYHFVGAVPGSTELESMLKRFLRELEVVHDSTMPRDQSSAAQLSCSSMCNPRTKPVVVFVDAVNQFEDESSATVMSWVPRKLAPQVRCIMSMINDTAHHQTFKERESKAQELHLMPLDLDSRKEIVFDLFSESMFKLGETQIKSLLSKRSSENPLWLSIACEQLKDMEYPTQRQLDTKIEQFPNGLLSLLEDVLSKFEEEKEGHLVVATLCLLEVSATGLLESELLQLLGRQDLTPPSPFDEKEEKESSEKESKNTMKSSEHKSISKEKWNFILKKLKPFLRPYGESGEGRLHFYHKSLSKAVHRKYFKDFEENERHEETEDLYSFWHHKLADFFEHCDNIDRKAEEYLHHLAKLADHDRLAECLCQWDIFDKLYHDEYSSMLLKYWRQAGGIDEMLQSYKKSLSDLESQEQRSERQIAIRFEDIARIFLQAGKYSDSLELCKIALKWEEKELGNRDERMVELYSLMAEIYDEKLKLNDFVSRSQLPDLRKTISFGRKSIELRKKLPGEYHKSKLGMSLMKLAFSLESWEACGGDAELSGADALREGNEHIDSALKIFQELRDMGHYAEALMTKGVLAPRGTMEQLKYYNQAMEICKQVFGEYSLLTSRLYINIGIVHEDNTDYVKAYEYFQKWARVSDVVLGPDHPKTLRAKGVLKEPRYRLVAQRLKEQNEVQAQNNENEDNNIDGAQINEEVERLLDTDESVVSNIDEENALEAADQMENAQMDINQMNVELQQAINELLRRALGELDNGADLLHNILNSVNLPHSNALFGALGGEVNNGDPNNDNSSSSNGGDGRNRDDDDHRDEHNQENL